LSVSNEGLVIKLWLDDLLLIDNFNIQHLHPSSLLP